MVDGNRSYRRQMFNESGYILLFPNVGDEKDLLQSFPPNPYAQSKTQQFPLGTKLIQGERVWRYCKNGTGTPAIGDALQGAASVTVGDLDILVAAEVAIGAYDITLTSQANAAVAKDYYKEGYLFVNEGTGLGQCYKIKSHTALVGTTVATVTLYDPVIVLIVTTTAKVGLRKNSHDAVITTPAPLTDAFVGVNHLALTASYYFWAKCKGYAPAVANTAIQVGSLVCVGETSGKVDPYSAADTNTEQVVIGRAVTPGVASTESFIVDLGAF